MSNDRFFVEADLKNETSIILEGTEFHHLSNVMRKRLYDEIELVNGKGILAFAKIEKIEKKEAVLSIEKTEEEQPPLKKICLAQSLMRLNRLDFILEKGTELGVDEFIFFPSENSEKEHFSSSQLNRMRNILISAIKQSNRLFLPSIIILSNMHECLEFEGKKYFGDLRKNTPSFLDILPKKRTENCYFFVGPEKGFTQEEIAFLENELKAVGVKLNKNILRAETAAIMSVGLIASQTM